MKTFEVTVRKEHGSTHLGLALAQKAGSSQIMIRAVSPKGAFGNTKVVPGLQLVQINATGFSTVQEATQLLKSTPMGTITVAVKGCVATAHKEDQTTKAGLSLKKITREEGVAGPAELIIDNISDQGILANSCLQPGYRISAINGTPCPQMLSEAISMIGAVIGELTVVAVESEIISKEDETKGSGLANPSLGAYLDKHHVSMGDSTFDTVKTVTGDESSRRQEEPEFTIEPNSEAAAERELNSMPIVQGSLETENGVFDSEYGGEEQEIAIEPNSAAASEQMRNTPCIEDEEPEGAVIDTEYGEAPETTQNHLKDVTTIISKGFPGEKVGLALKNAKQTKTVIVNRLVEDGLAIRSRSPLSLGQTILYINGQKCPPSAKRATALVTEAPRTITIIARNTVFKVNKATIDTKLGITLRSSKRKPNVLVQNVAPDGLFGDSILAKGQTIVAINGVDCPSNAHGAIELLKSAVGEISIVVGYKARYSKVSEYEESIPPTIVTTTSMTSYEYSDPPPPLTPLCPEEPQIVPTFQKEQVGARSIVSNKESGKWVGMSMNKTDGRITVLKIQDDSPLKDSSLQVGHAILYINGVECPDSITDLISMIYQTSGELVITSAPLEEANEILASKKSLPETSNAPATKSLPPGQVVAKVTKRTKEERIGIRVVRSLQERIVISTITKGGLLSTTDLVPGQFIVSVNGIPCPPTKEEVVQIIRDALGPIEIVASSSVGHTVKPTVSTKVGITIGRTVANEMIIANLAKDSLLQDDSPWALRTDQLVVSINGVPCPSNLQEAVALIRKCEGDLTIVAVDRFKRATTAPPKATAEPQSSLAPQQNGTTFIPSNGSKKSMPPRVEAAPELPNKKAPANLPGKIFSVGSTPDKSSQEFKDITAVVQNKEAGDMLGFSMGMTQDFVFCNHISADSPFCDTDLCVGHQIVKIDGEDCPLPLSDAVELFAQHVGTLTIDAKEQIVSPGQVSASIVKQSQHMDPGLGFYESDQGRIVISKIDPNGLFANSKLQLGQVLELINGMRCLDAETYHDTLATVSGKVTLVASMTVAKAVKQDIDQSAGIMLGQAPNGRDIVVKGIEESEVFGDSDLKIGQRVISIAGVSCPDNVAEAEGLIQDCVGELSIVAVDTLNKHAPSHVENGNGYSAHSNNQAVTVSVYKANQESKVGLKMRKGMQEGKVIISGLNEDGPAGGKGLEIGMYLISIDGIPCPPNPKTATGIIKEATGHFEIVASPTVASISKKTKDEKLGVTLSRTHKGDIVVHSIASRSSFKATDLQVGQKVVSINGKQCSGMLDSAIKALAESVGHVTIVALDTLKT